MGRQLGVFVAIYPEESKNSLVQLGLWAANKAFLDIAIVL